MKHLGILAACLVLLACGTSAPEPAWMSESEFGFRIGDASVEPALMDVDRDGKPDHVMVCKYELTRSDGSKMGRCNTKYIVTLAITKFGSNGKDDVPGSPRSWCSSQLPRAYLLRDGAAIWIDYEPNGWRVCVFDDVVMCFP